MAMNKNLDVGSILFTFHKPTYQEYAHSRGNEKYKIEFIALYVHNRRERTSGINVPKSLIPTLDKLKIRHVDVNSYYREHDEVFAIGCRQYVYYSCTSDMPYPTADELKAARKTLDEQLDTSHAVNQGVTLMEIDFIQDFKEKKVTNKDAAFSLLKPLRNYVENETYIVNN